MAEELKLEAMLAPELSIKFDTWHDCAVSLMQGVVQDQLPIILAANECFGASDTKARSSVCQTETMKTRCISQPSPFQ